MDEMNAQPHVWLNDMYNTIQGEGAMTGTPMTLIRLHGCSVGCHFCDTKESWTCDHAHFKTNIIQASAEPNGWCMMEPNDIAALVCDKYAGPDWCMITGGEPLEQNITWLVDALFDIGRRVALETSGTAANIDSLDGLVSWLTVSPKWNMPGNRPIVREVIEAADELKFVIGTMRDIEMMDRFIEEYPSEYAIIALQPVSNERGPVKRSLEICIDECIKRGWRLSPQTHKWMNVK